MTQKNDEIYLELIQNQRKECKEGRKLNLSELKRISKNLDDSIFDENKCSIWNGYITNSSSQTKPSYINFYFRGKKIALHRLIYENYVDDISDNQYLKFSCMNKGTCCNINHIIIVNSNKTCQKVRSTNEEHYKTVDTEKNIGLVVKFD